MNKHTPGPWNISTSLSGKLFVTIGHKIGMARKQVCEVLPSIDTGNYHGNAHLIAAAPELLAALQALVDYHESDYEIIPEVEVARTVLAKATGEAVPT